MKCVIMYRPEKEHLIPELRELAAKHKIFIIDFRRDAVSHVFSDNKEFYKEALALLRKDDKVS